ncbi:MAG: polysaccharide biosynthesis C-terminal domain-containing protein [Rhizomicrobium sp.]
MAFSFLLFMLLARQSQVTAAVFRTSVAYLVIAEFLGLLGTHRWLAVEIAMRGPERRPLFVTGIAYALLVSTGIAVVYYIISYSGIYSGNISVALRFVACGALASACLTCIQTTLVGMGYSSQVGLLNLTENVIRALIGIALVLLKQPVLSIIIVFVATRWGIMIVGLAVTLIRLGGSDIRPRKDFFKLFLRQTPQFAGIMVAFLCIRNAALIVLPAISGERETALFAVPYQLYDLLLLAPTILALTSTFVLTRTAAQSRASLRLAIMRLLTITVSYTLPLTALSIAFSKNILVFLAGSRYAGATLPFSVLVIAAPLMALDQVLSQAMISDGQFRNDRIAVTFGAICAVIGTVALGSLYGALGAAVAFVSATIVTLLGRFYLSGKLLKARDLLLIARKPALASILAYFVSIALLWFTRMAGSDIVRYTWPALAAVGLVVSATVMVMLGGLSRRKCRRMGLFLLGR